MNILFMCVANSIRSQMAEGLARHLLGPDVYVQSAGSKSSKLSIYAVKVMAEIGIDISQQHSKSVDTLPLEFLTHLDYVITLCAEEVCPTTLSKAKKLHWPLPDPVENSVSEDDLLKNFRQVRDLIKKKILSFLTLTGDK